MIFALKSSNELVLLAVASFSGTALMAPLIFLGIFSKGPHPIKTAMPILTAVAILLFILYKFKISFVPTKVIGFNMDLFLVIVLSLLALAAAFLSKKEPEKV